MSILGIVLVLHLKLPADNGVPTALNVTVTEAPVDTAPTATKLMPLTVLVAILKDPPVLKVAPKLTVAVVLMPCTMVSFTAARRMPAGTLSGPAPTLQPPAVQIITAVPLELGLPVTVRPETVRLHSFHQPTPLNTSVHCVVSLKMVSPQAGLAIALRSAVVITGGRNPLVLESTRKIAEVSGSQAP